MKEAIIQNRVEIYDMLRSNTEIESDQGIYLDYRISSRILQKLQKTTTDYIVRTLKETYRDEEFIIDNNFLATYEKKILNLPNRTPNGAFHPKKNNIVEYNKLQESIVDALRDIGILEHCLSVQPCTVRIMCGKNSDFFHKRPLATTKLHSDSWAAHIGDAILSVPLLGDPATSLEFFEPQGVSDDFFFSLENYDEGLKKFKGIKYLGFAQMGHVSIFDHACLHRTKLNDGNIRVSFDFGIIINNEKSLSHEAKSRNAKNLQDYRYEYFDIETYSKLGKDLFILVDETLEECALKHSAKNADLHERAPLKIVESL
jgi:hypothetical protein